MSFEELAKKSFSEKDVESFVKLLNMMHLKVAGLDGKEALEYFKLLQWAQSTMMPKIKSHVMGEPKIHEPSETKEDN